MGSGLWGFPVSGESSPLEQLQWAVGPHISRFLRPIRKLIWSFGGFDSSIFSCSKGGIPRSMGNFQEIWAWRFLVCGFFLCGITAGTLALSPSGPASREALLFEGQIPPKKGPRPRNSAPRCSWQGRGVQRSPEVSGLDAGRLLLWSGEVSPMTTPSLNLWTWDSQSCEFLLWELVVQPARTSDAPLIAEDVLVYLAAKSARDTYGEEPGDWQIM